MSAGEDTGRLAGRKILVTGGASGIGYATCELLRQRSADVALLDIDQEKTEHAARALSAHPIVVDLADGAAVDRAVAAAAAAMGGLDGVVNCAGVATPQRLVDVTPELWEGTYAVNVTAPYRILRAALPLLQASPRSSVVNVASGAGLLPSGKGGGSAYGSSKAALMGLSRLLAAELAPGIRVNTVCPGMTDTPMVRGRTGGPPPASNYALGRAADPAEIAAAIVFLLSDAASFITGSTLAVDGGRTYH